MVMNRNPCMSYLDPNTLRIARCVPNPYRPGSVTSLYKHISCTFDEFKQIKKGDARSFFKSSAELHGWNNIQQIDQEHVKCLINDLLEYRGLKNSNCVGKKHICFEENDNIGTKNCRILKRSQI